jgi:tetratricopeptide (TPR) repeat protein
MSRCERAAIVVAAILVASAPLARAQAEDEAAARVLFGEGRALMKRGDYAQACPKLEAAKRLLPSAGVLLNLGDCYEHLGKTASAWTVFSEAVASAQRGHRPADEVEAKNRQTALEPKLTRIVVRVTAPPPGLSVSRDDMALAAGAWNVAIPVDPGTHEIRAEAPGRDAWKKSVDASAPGATVDVEVPSLQTTPTVVVEVPVHPAPIVVVNAEPAPPYWNGRRAAGLAIAGVGVLAFGASVAMGFVAKSTYDTALAESGNARANDSRNAVTLGNAGTIVAIASGVLFVTGLVVWLTTPSRKVHVGASGSMLFLRGEL